MNLLKHKVKVGIVGVGYVGGALFHKLLNQVDYLIGIDESPAVQKRYEYIRNCWWEGDKYCDEPAVTSDFSNLSKCDVVILALPTPLDENDNPDPSILFNAARKAAPYLKDKCLVCNESTSYPGTSKQLHVMFQATNPGKTIYMVSSPERIDPGSHDDVSEIPKLLGADDWESGILGLTFYKRFVVDKVHQVSSMKAAEAAKLLENTFRMVNIGFINEFAIAMNAMGINVWEVIEAAETKPFGFMRFNPGPGVGGSCIPMDPLYLSQGAQMAGAAMPITDIAFLVNQTMPLYVVHAINDILTDDFNKILFLGVSYKKNSTDTRDTPFSEVYKELKRHVWDIDYYDPGIKQFEDMTSIDLYKTDLSEYDLVVLFTDHDKIDYEYVLHNSHRILDLRGRYRQWDEVKECDKITYL